LFGEEFIRVFGDRADFEPGTIPKEYDLARNYCAGTLTSVYSPEERKDQLRRAKEIINRLPRPKI